MQSKQLQEEQKMKNNKEYPYQINVRLDEKTNKNWQKLKHLYKLSELLRDEINKKAKELKK